MDDPIQSPHEDLLQRGSFVENLCKIFSGSSQNESIVFALYGEWGAGKTSVKNLLKKRLATYGNNGLLFLEFNPWAFSGQDQVLEAFFSEIGKAVGNEVNGEDAAEGFKKLGAYLSFGAKTAKTSHVVMDLFGIPGAKIVGLIGEQIEAGSKSARDYGKDLAKISHSSLEQVQRELKRALIKFERPLLIILDDLDRLTSDQLLTVFQIVKLNANLPRVNYLLLMDRTTAEKRLEEKNLGAEFIEKIVQFELNLPFIGERDLKAILKQGFGTVMSPYNERIQWERWEEAWAQGCRRLFTTLRRIKRFLLTLKFHVQLFANDEVLEVDPVDLFLIEVFRKFAPFMYDQLPKTLANVVYANNSADILFFLNDRQGADYGKSELDSALAVAPGEFKGEIEHLLKLAFPQIGHSPDVGQKMENIRDGRVCSELFFESYFRLAIPAQQLTQKEIKELFDSMGSREALKSKLLEYYKKVGLREVLIRIQCHHTHLSPDLIPNLLSELWRLDDQDTQAAGMDRSWETRYAMYAMSTYLLKNHCPESKRKQIAVLAMQDSESVYQLARLVSSEIETQKKHPDSRETVFTTEELDELRKDVVQQIRTDVATGRLLNYVDGGILLQVWARLEPSEEMREWIKTQLREPKRLPLILSRLVSKATVSDNRGTRAHFSVSRKLLESFFDLDQLERALTGLNPESLPHWEKFAVEETLKRLDEKRRGMPEPEFPE